MQHTYYLLAANLVVWTGISVYLVFLGQKYRHILRRLQQLEISVHDRN